MDRRAFIVAVLLAVSPAVAGAQMRRSGGDAPAPAGEVPKGTPRDDRHPYVGVWNGTFSIIDATRGNHEIPIVMVLRLDEANGEYSGETVLPNGARAPHLETKVVNGEIRWKQDNSGGGFWVYTGKLVGRDSVAGTVSLQGWPQLAAGEKPPSGTFSVVRRAPGT